MSKFIVCKTTGKSEQSYFLEMDNKLYFLFKQDYRVSNKEYYAKGVNVNDAVDYSKTHSEATRNTMERLRKALTRLEKETGIAVWDKTVHMSYCSGHNTATKAQRIFRARLRALDVA